jgi:hypothetical protein
MQHCAKKALFKRKEKNSRVPLGPTQKEAGLNPSLHGGWPVTNCPTHGHPSLSLLLKSIPSCDSIHYTSRTKEILVSPCFRNLNSQRRSCPSYRSRRLSRQTETLHSGSNTQDDLIPTARQLYYSPRTNTGATLLVL